MKRQRAILAFTALLLIGLGAPQAVGAWRLEVTSVWYEVTADRINQVEFYTYTRGLLVGDPGTLDEVLIYSCAKAEIGYSPSYCGAGVHYTGNLHAGKVFECDGPHCTKLGKATKPECGTGQTNEYWGIGSIKPCGLLGCPQTPADSLEGDRIAVDCYQDDVEDPNDDPPDECNNDGCTNGSASPVIVDLDGGSIRLGSLHPDPVAFDIDADGDHEWVSWTLRDTGDAFLALDRNANGIIDDGSELFGNVTPLAGGGLAAHGFEALAEFDLVQYGGNGDQLVDAWDAVFPGLLFWLDMNRNGQSEPSEMAPAAYLGLVSISLDFIESRKKDRHGNEFRYMTNARVFIDGRVQTRRASDVFLLMAEASPE